MLRQSLDKIKPRSTFALAKIKFSVSSEEEIFGNFKFTCENCNQVCADVFRSFLYRKLKMTEKQFAQAVRDYVLQRLGLKEKEFSGFMRVCMAQYVLEHTTNPYTKRSMQEFLEAQK